VPIHPVGARLGPYEIVGFLGAGGMGEVYKARDTRLQRSVAIKVSKETFEERFRNEARAVAALSHPHICSLFDVGPDYLVMEHVEGRTLHGPLPVAEVLRLALQIADALEHAHGKGILHRDLKPANILVPTTGEPKVGDFGLAHLLDSQSAVTRTGTTLGTPLYMSPEQCKGAGLLDHRTDIYSLGVILYEMATGRSPFRGRTVAGILGSILTEAPAKPSELNPAVPPRVDRLILKALEKEREDRDVEIHKSHRASETGDRVCQAILSTTRALRTQFDQRGMLWLSDASTRTHGHSSRTFWMYSSSRLITDRQSSSQPTPDRSATRVATATGKALAGYATSLPGMTIVALLSDTIRRSAADQAPARGGKPTCRRVLAALAVVDVDVV
jgi:serine/threonine protein kinase